ncbi:chemotaxis protein CheA [Rhodopirellula sallentina]|uniref:histidine kinase n=1 Tax=Rhodopirellula sallentina SM41 TaxID=1263870 RepID=M5U3H4_9BACT|nr:ATP-binding protein [Rhodopirellula sallentina]EMI55809.1 protein containing ATP-binding region, ATPase-like protein [Rhodopirellula sallentina SM41]
MDDSELIAVFVDEARGHLRVLETRVLQLDSHDSSINQDLIDDAFRAVHTLKGAAGYMRLIDVVMLSHRLENVFAALRDGELSPDEETANVLLAAIDRMSLMVESLPSGRRVDAMAVCGRLDAHLKEFADCRTPTNSNPAKQPPANPNEFQSTRGSAAETKTPAPKGHDTIRRDPNRTSDDQASGRVHKSLDQIQTQIDNVFAATPSQVTADSITPASQSSQRDDLHDRSESIGLGGEPLKFVRVPVEVLNRIERAAEQLIDDRDRLLGILDSEDSLAHSTPTRSTSDSTANNSSANNSTANNRTTNNCGGTRKTEKSARVMQGEMIRPIVTNIGRASSELHEAVRRVRLRTVDSVFAKFPRYIADLAESLGKEITPEIHCDAVEADCASVDAIADPLMHLVRNACDHGLESPAQRVAAGKPSCGTIVLRAYHEVTETRFEVTDDGAGIDPQAIKQQAIDNGLVSREIADSMSAHEIRGFVFLPGFSTARVVSEISGRGVGMDVVKTNVESIGGIIEIESTVGKGTTVRITLPRAISSAEQ